MPDDRCDSGDQFQIGHPEGAFRHHAGHQNRQHSLADIAHRDHYPGSGSGRPPGIGGPDIARTDRTDIFDTEQTGYQEGKWDRSQQIAA